MHPLDGKTKNCHKFKSLRSVLVKQFNFYNSGGAEICKEDILGSDEVDVEGVDGEVEESENEKEDKIEELQLSQEVFNVPILLAEDSPQCNVVEAHVLQLEGGTIAYIHSQPQGNYLVYVYIKTHSTYEDNP